MTVAKLMTAHLRKMHEQLGELRRQRDDLLSSLRKMEASRDAWREKAKSRRLALKAMTASRDLWRHRAMTRLEGETHADTDRTDRRIAA